MDRGAWRLTVQGVAKNRKRLKWLTYTHNHNRNNKIYWTFLRYILLFHKIPFNPYRFSLNWRCGRAMLVSPKHKLCNQWAEIKGATSSICPFQTCLPIHISLDHRPPHAAQLGYPTGTANSVSLKLKFVFFLKKPIFYSSSILYESEV